MADWTEAADMIWALLAWYFFGGGGAGSGAILTSSGVDDISDQVAIVVEDETRRQSAKQTLKGLKKELKTFEKSFTKSGRKLNKLYKDHADNREEALAILAELNSEWKAGQENALDARFALRDTMTEDEWAAVFGDE
jgi:hypothetical protein